MDVDLVVDRDQEELELEVVRLGAVVAGVGIREALELERVHLVKEEVLPRHLTEELLHQEQLLREDQTQQQPREELTKQQLRRELKQQQLKSEQMQQLQRKEQTQQRPRRELNKQLPRRKLNKRQQPRRNMRHQVSQNLVLKA